MQCQGQWALQAGAFSAAARGAPIDPADTFQFLFFFFFSIFTQDALIWCLGLARGQKTQELNVWKKNKMLHGVVSLLHLFYYSRIYASILLLLELFSFPEYCSLLYLNKTPMGSSFTSVTNAQNFNILGLKHSHFLCKLLIVFLINAVIFPASWKKTLGAFCTKHVRLPVLIENIKFLDARSPGRMSALGGGRALAPVNSERQQSFFFYCSCCSFFSGKIK